MTISLIIPELVIIIAVKNQNPQSLTPEFLKGSGTVPADWELASQPICTARGSQVTFANGISIVAEPNRIMFIEAIDGKADKEVAIPALARKYVQTLPYMEYQAIGINPRGFAAFDASEDAARKYINETLFSKGAWQEVGNQPMRATINLAYTLERGQFSLSVSEAGLRQPDETTTPIIMFTGNFSYDLDGKNSSDSQAWLHQTIENWQIDFNTYKDIVNSKFLAEKSSASVVVPDIFTLTASARA